MKIKYAFLDGTVTEVEVSEDIGAVIIDSRKAEHAQDERHRYHCYSYDAIDYEGEEYGACDEYAVEDDSAEQTARIHCLRYVVVLKGKQFGVLRLSVLQKRADDAARSHLTEEVNHIMQGRDVRIGSSAVQNLPSNFLNPNESFFGILLELLS